MNTTLQSPAETTCTDTPTWLSKILAVGFEPYIATSEHLLSSFNLKPFGVPVRTFIMNNTSDKPFLDAYLSANFLSFGSKDADYKMPSWVYVDCVLLQSTVVGFMAPKSILPEALLAEFREGLPENFAEMEHIPISGEIDSPATDGSYVNFSLFSLGRRLNNLQKMAVYTKALSTEVLGIRNSGKNYRIILQYNNPAIKVQGLLTSKMEIEQPIVSLHPGKHMTLVVKMLVDYDPHKLEDSPEPVAPSFLMEAHDIEKKRYMENKIQQGYSFSIVPPYAEHKDSGIFIPICEHSPPS